MKTKIKFDPRAVYHAPKLEKDGSVDYSKIPKLTQQPINPDTPEGRLRLLSGEHLTADQKLRRMLDDELERRNEEAETIFDSFDFEVKPNYEPSYHPLVTTEMISQKDVKEAYYARKKLEREEARKKTDGEVPAGSKPAKTGGAPAPGKQNTKSKSARQHTEGADEEDE